MARILFMGTPEYARRILDAIWTPEHEWRVVTKPDMPVGRRQVLTPSPVAMFATELGLAVDKPVRLWDFRDVWTAYQPDWILTAAFGRILPRWVLDLPRWGAYNLHASLLPRWRGANPIAWAIRAQDAETGITLMQMDEGIDTGPVAARVATPILADDTTSRLTERLAELAAQLWLTTARGVAGPLPVTPQPSDGACYAPKFAPGEARLDWRESAETLDAWVRSMTPEPGAYTMLDDQRVKILTVSVDPNPMNDAPGTARLVGNRWRVATGRGALWVEQIHPAGRRPMSPGDFVRGRQGEHQWTLI